MIFTKFCIDFIKFNFLLLFEQKDIDKAVKAAKEAFRLGSEWRRMVSVTYFYY